MNALRSRISSHMIWNKNGALRSLALSTVISTTTGVGMITACEGKQSDGDMFAKVKEIATTSLNVDAVGQLLGSKVQEAVDSGVPTQISYGFLCGYSSGFALKKVGKVASVVFGLGFVTLQSLSYAGYLQIDHSALKKDVENALDLNKDGKVDDDDAMIVYDKLMEILQFNMTGGSGFVAGFLGGFRSG